MNRERHIPLPPAGLDCAAFAPLLPLAGQRLLDERDATRLQEHVAGCGHCRALFAAYDRLDAALVRRFEGQTQGVEGLTEAIMDHIEDQQNPLPPPPITAPPAPLPTPARGRRGLVTSLGAVAAVLAIAVVTAALFAGRGLHGATGPGGEIPPSPSQPGPQLISVGDVAMVSPNDGWAYGEVWGPPEWCAQQRLITPQPTRQPFPGGGPFHGCSSVMLHYDGHAWVDAGSVGFWVVQGSLTMVSASEGWALAEDATSHRMEVVHYSGGHWFVDSRYAFPGDAYYDIYAFYAIQRLAMVSANEGWAIGPTNPAPLLHYIQGHWVPGNAPSFPQSGDLRSISMLNANEGWAVGFAVEGSDNVSVCLVEHYHNGLWTKEDVAFPGSLNSVYAVSPDEAWAVGEENPISGPGLILHYKSGKWTKVTGLQLNILQAVTMVSPTEGWAVGDSGMFLHYDYGIWSHVGLPIHHLLLTGVSMGSATDGWAVGIYINDNSNDGKNLFHYSGGKWMPYSLAALASQLGKG